MPAGLSGFLLSASFLEGRLGTVDVDVRARHRFAAARQASTALGPSSSLRSMLDAGAAPVVDALGFGPPQDVERVGAVLASTFAAGDERVALIVAPWAEPLDLLSRVGYQAGDAPLRPLVRALQRHAPAPRGRGPSAFPPVRAVRSRHGRRRRRSVRGVCVRDAAPARLAATRWSRHRSGMASPSAGR